MRCAQRGTTPFLTEPNNDMMSQGDDPSKWFLLVNTILLSILRGNPGTITRHMPGMILPALVLCYCLARFALPGILTAFQVLSLAASAACFTEYRTDRGLWMLAALFAVIWLSISAMQSPLPINSTASWPPLRCDGLR
jgi:hypothetical protein